MPFATAMVNLKNVFVAKDVKGLASTAPLREASGAREHSPLSSPSPQPEDLFRPTPSSGPGQCQRVVPPATPQRPARTSTSTIASQRSLPT